MKANNNVKNVTVSNAVVNHKNHVNDSYTVHMDGNFLSGDFHVTMEVVGGETYQRCSEEQRSNLEFLGQGLLAVKREILSTLKDAPEICSLCETAMKAAHAADQTDKNISLEAEEANLKRFKERNDIAVKRHRMDRETSREMNNVDKEFDSVD